MNTPLTPAKRERAVEIVRRLQAAGHEAFFVGGCVRDAQLGRTPEDFDIATSARPEQVETLFPRTVPVGRQFGVLIVLSGPDPFQVATFRAEHGYVDGRHPTTVRFSDAREDALRRDFTVNGLFFDPVSGNCTTGWAAGRTCRRASSARSVRRRSVLPRTICGCSGRYDLPSTGLRTGSHHAGGSAGQRAQHPDGERRADSR